ncbi:metal-dependent hydrolase [Nakamurella flavida]|uniref:Metal-dependent hydrolase n=1 Tax=Nakamurella flavida TaxID=363630 RepID=A0A938YQ58_9ACTN|nr:metal-dependent hydrolase [Nakamurella flavida]MBM9477349.1 metal-dependent hydrolase [Nakamurella flavida]MDP9777281.1 alanyl-tRNA synthetase [Nakamurella flavida]
MSHPVTDTVLHPSATATRVSYPTGGTHGPGTVVGLARFTGRDGGGVLGVVLDATAAHPVSPTWPDQPADRGELLSAARTHALLDVRQGVLHDGLLTVDVSAGRVPGDEVVVHLVDPGASLTLGERVEVIVDAEWRRSLSLAHSACHLGALALDAALAPLWSRSVATDPLGHPAFDRLAITSSTLSPRRAVDVYRLGKSLRKKGFDGTRLTDELAAVAAAQAATLDRWLAQDTATHVEAGDGTLSARRRWCGTLDGIEVDLPCGGTHVASTGELAGITVEHQLSEAADALTVTTSVPAG